MTLTIGWYFVTTFSHPLNVGCFFCIINFEGTFRNKFEKGDWGFVIKVGANTIIDNIDVYPSFVQFVPTHIACPRVHSQRESRRFKDIWVVVTWIYGRSTKSFVLVMSNGLEVDNTQALSFFLKFYAQYVQLMHICSTWQLAISLIKNIDNVVYGEKKFLTKFSSIFIILVPFLLMMQEQLNHS